MDTPDFAWGFPSPKSTVTGTEHDDRCEECEAELTKENVTEGDLGFYCSHECLELAESGYSDPCPREDFHSDC